MTKTFKDWYAENKQELNARRAAKRAADPEYRTRQLSYQSSRALPDPVGGMDLQTAADTLQISVWAIRGWRKRGYLPTLVWYKGRYWMHRDNLALLLKLRDRLDGLGRLSAHNRSQLEDLSNLVFSNWKELEKVYGPEVTVQK